MVYHNYTFLLKKYFEMFISKKGQFNEMFYCLCQNNDQKLVRKHFYNFFGKFTFSLLFSKDNFGRNFLYFLLCNHLFFLFLFQKEFGVWVWLPATRLKPPAAPKCTWLWWGRGRMGEWATQYCWAHQGWIEVGGSLRQGSPMTSWWVDNIWRFLLQFRFEIFF